jgi:hypothetical protein
MRQNSESSDFERLEPERYGKILLNLASVLQISRRSEVSEYLDRGQDADTLWSGLSVQMVIQSAVMEIGQKVKVCRLRDRVSQDIINRLGQTGVIQDFRVLDGSQVGIVVQFDDKFSTWFFEDELAAV